MSGMSIRRTDLLALSGLRNDGRKANEIRRMRIQMGPVRSLSGGSALVEMGLTIALATVVGPTECYRRSDERLDRAIVDVTVRSAPFSTGGDRRATNPNTDRRLLEMSRQIRDALEATILLHLFPKSRIEVTIVILADDGGRICAGMNAATLALVHAGIPLRDFCCACTAGYSGSYSSSGSVDDSSAETVSSEGALIDLNRREEGMQVGQAPVVVTCAMLPQRSLILFAQCCESRIPNIFVLEQVIDSATNGCRAIFDVMQQAVREHASKRLLSSRSDLQEAFQTVGDEDPNTSSSH
jgi:exosome complex component RRP41